MSACTQNFGKVLVLAAHPDDETIACSGMLQRATNALVVFTVDGAPPHYRFERKFGSLQSYSDHRFREAAAALAPLAHCSFRRLARQDGTWFVDQHLFQELSEAFVSLCQIAREFSPDLIASHAFEGGHLDHDACHVLAKHAAITLQLPILEFPLYWSDAPGKDRFQQFREVRSDEFVLQLSPQELLVKRTMLAEYKSQQMVTSVFQPEIERFRPMAVEDCLKPVWSYYPYENRRKPWKAESFFHAIASFQEQQIPQRARMAKSCSHSFLCGI